jgi:hypothetical protein
MILGVNITSLFRTAVFYSIFQCNLPFQSIYCTALDHDVENSNSNQITYGLLLGKKFVEVRLRYTHLVMWNVTSSMCLDVSVRNVEPEGHYKISLPSYKSSWKSFVVL